MKTTRAIRLVIGFAAMWVASAAVLVSAEESRPGSPSARAVEAIRLLDSKDVYQRQLGFLRLEALRESGTIEVIQRYLQHEDPDTRAYSVRALAAIQGVDAAPMLLHALRRDHDARVRRAAILGLEPFASANPDILPTLINALRDKKPDVRIVAVDVVSRIDDPRAKDAILTRRKRERSSDVRRILVLAMKRME